MSEEEREKILALARIKVTEFGADFFDLVKPRHQLDTSHDPADLARDYFQGLDVSHQQVILEAARAAAAMGE